MSAARQAPGLQQRCRPGAAPAWLAGVAALGLLTAAGPVRAQQGLPPAGTPVPTLKLIPVAPPPDPAADMAKRIAATTDRAALLELLAAGVDKARITARLVALGFIDLAAGSTRLWVKPGSGEVFRDCADCPDLVLVPDGDVRMQLSTGAKPRLVEVTVPQPFAVGRFEVTKAQYRAFVAQSGHVVELGCHVRAPVWKLDPTLSWQDPGFPQTDDDPVACISHGDAKAYLAWLSKRSGQRYRLLTDPEWHHVAAASAKEMADPARLCAIGNGADETAKLANPSWTVAPCRDGFRNTAPVGRFAASAWGLGDLSGNLWEWVDTCPPDPSVPGQPFPPPICREEEGRILRGGSWADPPAARTLDSRIVSEPGIRDQVAGFRVARDLGN
ncbi:SUMF1/EgtB/PvdO family nonheme iron enzyme [Bosea sp. (in: a-proteobacteria)]|uniref:formylglycine-generating enzyme family protein n=1 Tax=Bosea sp. (in: a-proteobacteria) TaxID=1871050 RepID=UPI00273717EA|nr:SUMF1/EgtB/PvdO family nonheme iron enzyme [Bosea sp. (in: a-proteobacteria)]MDP3407563.1 SUMF1/EgtB/PvdO family nonheme iron enzyme [Bosea sp. (in: a-proteobacteria)]